MLASKHKVLDVWLLQRGFVFKKFNARLGSPDELHKGMRSLGGARPHSAVRDVQKPVVSAFM